MPRNVFYYHRNALNVKEKYADLKQRIIELYHQHKGRYGYRRITVALKQLGEDLVSKMLALALDKTKKSRHNKLILYSDQGWHDQMKHFSKMLKKHKIRQSMSRKATA